MLSDANELANDSSVKLQNVDIPTNPYERRRVYCNPEVQVLFGASCFGLPKIQNNFHPGLGFSGLDRIGECGGRFSNVQFVGGDFEMDRKKNKSGRGGFNQLGYSQADGTIGEGSSQEFGFEPSYKDLNKNHRNDVVTNITSTTDKKPEMTALYHLFSEDMRISKILRRLCAENNPATAIELCEKLQIATMDSSNAAYIRRAFDFLAESIISVMENGPIECLDHVAKVFGMLGYVNRYDFLIYKNWIVKNYEAVKDIRVGLMRALKITIKFDAATLDLTSFSDRLIITLKDMLENADVVEHFIAVSDVIAEFASNYKRVFEKHFTDIVDIVVGWHLETEQSPKLKQHCSIVLQRFSEFFIKKLDFTLGLLGQFLEDIGTFGEDIENHYETSGSGGGFGVGKDKSQSPLPEVSVGSFVGAFNSVMKCLSTDKEMLAFKLGRTLFEEAVITITHVACKSLKITYCPETVQNINEFFIIIQNYGIKENIIFDVEKLIEIIRIEVDRIHNFDNVQISSLLFLLLTFIHHMKANVPIKLITFVLDASNKDLCQLKLTKNSKHFNNLLKLYQEILTIKNVPLLQEAYKQILIDIKRAIKTINAGYQNNDGSSKRLEHQDNFYSLPEAECVLNFYLSAISVLAIQTSSIIGMYALQPTILELLIKDLSASNMRIWSINPALHDSIITLLSVHCIKNHNYILSSNLLMSNVFSKLSLDDISPTSENFANILKFHVEILSDTILPPDKTLIRILDWLHLLYQQCAQHTKTLKNHQPFIDIGKSICSISICRSIEISLHCVNCINAILDLKDVNLTILNAIAEVCCVNMTSTNVNIREKYSKIFGKLPLATSLRQVNYNTGILKSKSMKLSELQHFYTNSISSGHMREKYFKIFIENISFMEECEFVEFLLKDIFPKCWTAHRGRAVEFYSSALSNLIPLINWAQWESAQHCVNNKLRTSLGKPQDTFLKIEAAVKEAARILALKEVANIKDVSSLIANQKNTRILLGFLESLEKSIYNAAEGSAFAMPAPEKPVRTFFRVNTSTCNEWFNRIRTAVDLVALHSMEPEMVMRCSEVMLHGLVTSGRTNEALFEHTLMSYVWALLKKGESEALFGLYTWTKLISGKRIAWIKYASEHAAGRREKAAEGYASILNANNDKLDKHIKDFITDQLIDCLYFTSQWDLLKECFDKEKTYERVTIPLMTITESQLKSLEELENSSNMPMIDMTDWKVVDRLEDIPNNFSYHKILSLTENTVMEKIIKNDTYESSTLKACANIIQSGIEECLRTNSKEHLMNLIILNHVVQKVCESNVNEMAGDIDLSSFNIDKINGSVNLIRTVRWADMISKCKNESKNSNFDLHLDVASMARKDGNLKLCMKELKNIFKHFNCGDNFELPEVCATVIEENLNNVDLTQHILRGACETAKWLYSQNKCDDALQLAASSCITVMSKKRTPPENISERISRILLILSDWLPQGSENSLKNDTPLVNLLCLLPDVQGHNNDGNINVVIPPIDAAVGKCIQASSAQSPNLAKAWSSFGNWCYRWGRKIVEARNEANSDKAGLRTSDIEAIQNLIANGTEEDVEKIVVILNKHQVTTADDEEIGPNDISSTELIENDLRRIEILADVSGATIASIIQIWRQAHKSVYGYYELAAEAYFKYLNLSTIETTEIFDGFNGGNENSKDCSLVTATLRLLRLVVKHALGLQEVIEEGLTTTPTHPWKVIIPQLFSRLNHHEPYVRKRVSELLCRVAKDSPHLIIFPAVVGAVQEEKNDNNFTDTSFHDDERTSTINPLTLCFNSLLDTLSKQAPETVEQVQLLVRELKRVTLLWEEFWLHSLAQLYSEYSELFSSIETEVRKCSDEKITILTEKHRILMEYVVEDMQRLQTITSRPPETISEKLFQEKYSKLIENTIEELKKPLNFEKPNESWQKLKQLYAVFQQKLQKSSQASLKMGDISPVLANMKNTAISMPGVETNENKPIYIKAVDSTVYILPTKTKPKKLAFFGSDGKRYTYLFKGLEDLHLDERIMQFLSISNSMMSKSIDCNGNVTSYKAHHYSVIPLGPRSGLITWVDGVTPLFALYKRWQHREAANPKKDKKFAVMRPSEMFYNKLTPLLEEHNIKTTDSRKTWPISVLRKVLEELKEETPRDLLAKELWCHSNNPAEWRCAVRTYSLSVAVMSVIGYVIGLGDRHLDNVLVKLSTGDIVHIDYNVCFEKGKTLRVPERVPFRMTPNLEEALGITGIEGTFRFACEHVLKTLRKERETLLTLLEAFVYDPLVDWAMSDDGTTASTRTTKALIAATDIAALEACTTTATISTTTCEGNALPSPSGAVTNSERRPSRKKLENEVIRNTLSSRFAEIKPEWSQYSQDINEQLTYMAKYLDELNEKRQQVQNDESHRDLISKQLAMIRELETLSTAMSSHPLNTISQRYAEYRKAAEDFDHIKKLLSEQYIDFRNKYATYNLTMSEFNSNRKKELLIELEEACQIEIQNEFDIVKEFLETSAQGAMYVQGDQARKELDASFLQQYAIIKCALDSLEEYNNIMIFYPKDDESNHRLVKYQGWFQKLLDSPDVCNNVLCEFNEIVAKEKISEDVPNHAVQYAFEMEKTFRETNNTLSSGFDILQKHLPLADERVLEEAQEAIAIFKQVENGSTKAIQSALTMNLCKTIEDFLTFEETCLKSLGSGFHYQPDTNWILDEQASHLTYLIEAPKLLLNEDVGSTLTPITEALKSLQILVQTFKDFDTFFLIEVIPKIVQILLKNNKSCVDFIGGIIGFEEAFDLELTYNRIQTHINCCREVHLLKQDFRKNLDNLENLEAKELFEMVDQMFTTIYNTIEAALFSVNSVINSLHDKDKVIKSMDHICRSSYLALRIFEKYSTEIFQQQFEIRKFQTISQLCVMAKKMVMSLKGSNLELVYNLRIMHQPILSFIDDYEASTIFGLGSFMGSLLEYELLNINFGENRPPDVKSVDELAIIQSTRHLQIGTFSESVFSYAQAMCSNLSTTIRQAILVAHLKRAVATYTEIVQHIRLILTVHIWMNEKSFINQQLPAHVIPKKQFLQNLQSAVQNLKAWKISIEKIKDELTTFTTAVLQRLRWAVGANPNLSTLQQSFDEFVTNQANKYTVHCKIASTVLKYLCSVVDYELHRCNRPEIIQQDERVLLLMSQYSKAFKTQQIAANAITSVEQATVQLLDPEGPVDHYWINNISGLLDEMTDNVQRKIASLEKDLHSAQDNLQLCANKLRTLMDSELRMDIRYLMKLILKIDGRHKQFHNNYKQFFNHLSDLHIRVLSKDFTEENVKECRKIISLIRSEMEEIYNDLLRVMNEKNSVEEQVREKRDRSEGKSTGTPTKDSRKGNLPEQKRNAYAVSVWRRIRMKLEGRDPDPNRRLTVAEQVDWMIREAMNPDNLAVLYEGWTPWV